MSTQRMRSIIRDWHHKGIDLEQITRLCNVTKDEALYIINHDEPEKPTNQHIDEPTLFD